MSAKKINTVIVLILVVPLFFFSCSGDEISQEEYAQSIAEWDSSRLERLKAPGGWLNLAGLFWLHEGENTIGASSDNHHVFPRGPENIGKMYYSEGKVEFTPAQGVPVKSGGEQVESSVPMTDADGRATRLTVDSLEFFIIGRGERTGIRLRDFLHPRLEQLTEIDRYPPDQDWIIKARFIEPEDEITVRVPDVLGDISEENVPGILEFEHDGEIWRLYPTGSRDRLFVIFADDTNALETYGAGRFLSGGAPDNQGYVYLDFNKAYNPPCAFSPYATCPLPPKENFLPFRVTAGEKAVTAGYSE